MIFTASSAVSTTWKMSKSPTGKLHTDYKQEAAKRTVIRRLVKMLFNSSLNTTEEQTALIGSYNRTTEAEYDDDNVIKTDYADSSVEDVKAKQEKKVRLSILTKEENDKNQQEQREILLLLLV